MKHLLERKEDISPLEQGGEMSSLAIQHASRQKYGNIFSDFFFLIFFFYIADRYWHQIYEQDIGKYIQKLNIIFMSDGYFEDLFYSFIVS